VSAFEMRVAVSPHTVFKNEIRTRS